MSDDNFQYSTLLLYWFISFCILHPFFPIFLSLSICTQWVSELIHGCYIAKWNVCSYTQTHRTWRTKCRQHTEKNYYNLVPLLAFMISLCVCRFSETSVTLTIANTPSVDCTCSRNNQEIHELHLRFFFAVGIISFCLAKENPYYIFFLLLLCTPSSR